MFYGDPYSTKGCRTECDSDDDCDNDKTCTNTRCIDPCPGACGINAYCQGLQHKPICSCPAGYTGDAYSRCKNIELDSPKEYVTTPRPASPCSPSPCAYNAQCSVEYNVAKCTCLHGYEGDPYTECRPECVSNNECDRDKACIENKCQDPCDGICGVNALCEVDNHNPICYCPTHLTGDPFSRCFEREGKFLIIATIYY